MRNPTSDDRDRLLPAPSCLVRARWSLALALLLAAAPALPADGFDRGRALYETRCVACHDRSVHRRESRLATDFAALRRQVERWNESAGGEWRTEEIDQVTAYLNERYYRFPCPPSICREAARAQVRPAGS